MAGDDMKERMDKRLSGLLAKIALSVVYLRNNLMLPSAIPSGKESE